MKYKHPTESEFKGIIQVITESTRELFSIKEFSSQVRGQLRREYARGLMDIDKLLKPPVNTQMPSNSARQLEALYNYVEQNLQDHIDEVGKSLRQEVQRGLQNNETKQQIISRVRKVFANDKGVISRLKMVIRTETNRANSQGRLEAANQASGAGMNLRKWLQVVPYQKGRSSPFCNTPAGKNGSKSANGKYGDPEKAIPLKTEFLVKDGNKTVRAQGPPFHPNCRTTLRIIRAEDMKK